MDEYKYKFSVVIPVYNVEEYVEESIQSVIQQDIGFKENIQIILVNDGSTDNSKEICLKYVNQYPENIIYIEQKNQGVSAARNTGLKYAQGKYINFLDSDDTWREDVFTLVYHFFEENQKKIDMVACRQRFFGAINGFKHALDYKFKKNEIVDIKEQYQKIQLSVASAFFKKSVVQKYTFNTQLKYSEDANLVTKLVLDKEKYGSLRNAVYNYRKRDDNSSAIQISTFDKSWYINTVEKCYMDLFTYSKKKYGRVIPYIQYQIMYDMQWRLEIPFNNILDEQEGQKYLNNIKQLLKEIDDNIICEQKKLSIGPKLYALNLKYNKDIRKELTYRNKKIYFNNIPMFKIMNNWLMVIRILEIKDGKLLLEGQITCPFLLEDYAIHFEDNHENEYQIKYYSMEHKKRYGMDRVILEPRGFKVEIPLEKVDSLRAVFVFKNYNSVYIKLKFEAYSKLHYSYRYSYYAKGKYIIGCRKNIIRIIPNTLLNHMKAEILYSMQLVKYKEFKAVWYRFLYYITKPFYKKPIWIVSDRMDMADDNGLHMFRYLMKHEKDAKIYFVISRKSRDYPKVKKIGPVLKFESLQYKIKFLHADKIISSQANDFTINAFGKMKQCLKNLYKFDFVFLQHGITGNDLSDWLHKQNKNIRIFVTSARDEYNSIIHGNYGYDKEIVKLTGFPRYDNLISKEKPKKEIIFMPTWRKNVVGAEIGNMGLREYNPKFKEILYCQFYNKLINEPKILNVLKEKGYIGKFCVHPNFKEQDVDFNGNDYIEVVKETSDYQKEFKENKLLITDFSSVAFDFAYLKKPVIYTQFDINTFFEEHMCTKGYFDYERDGLGEVCYDYETSVNTIIKYINNDCKLDKKYEERINKFYYKFDTNNCKRVYQEICKLNKK